MAKERAPLVIVHGHHKIYVNNPDLIDQTFKALGLCPAAHHREPSPHASVSGYLASAASQILDAAASRFPELRLRSLRDVIFHVRRDAYLSTDQKKFVQGLHKAFSFVRHMPDADIQEQTEAVCHSLLSSIDVGVVDAAEHPDSMPARCREQPGRSAVELRLARLAARQGGSATLLGSAVAGSIAPLAAQADVAAGLRQRRTRRKGRTQRQAEAGVPFGAGEVCEATQVQYVEEPLSFYMGEERAEGGVQGGGDLDNGGAAAGEPPELPEAARDARAARLRAALSWSPGAFPAAAQAIGRHQPDGIAAVGNEPRLQHARCDGCERAASAAPADRLVRAFAAPWLCGAAGMGLRPHQSAAGKLLRHDPHLAG